MQKEIINSDCSRNWQANILLDNITRLEQENNSLQAQLNNITVQSNNAITALEQENKELKEMLSKEPKAMQAFQIAYSSNKKENEVLWGMVKDYKTALEEISSKLDRALDADETDAEESFDLLYEIQDKIEEVLNEN